MSGPNPPGREPDEPDFAGEPSAEPEPAADGDNPGSDFGPDLDLGAGYGGELEPFDAGHDVPEITGGVDDVVVVAGLARLLLLPVRVTSSDTETTSAIAATIAATPTTQGHRGVACSSSSNSS